jgi:hypothetical protein
MRFVVRIFNAKSGRKSYALIGKTKYKDFYLTFDTMAICLALNVDIDMLNSMELGEYEI